MTGSLTQRRHERLKAYLSELETTLEPMRPLLKQMHLLSSNAVSAAARAGSEGDAFRVLTHGIQELGQEIHQDLQQINALLETCLGSNEPEEVKRHCRLLANALSSMPQSVKKGEYLAICASVESAHAANYGDSFHAVADMLKQLIRALREQVSKQKTMMEKVLTISQH